MTAKEVLPNPGDLFQSLRYLQDQAARGSFDGHTSAYLVLLHLTMNMWTKVPNKEDAILGMVMYGRSSIDSIVAHTTLSRPTVKRAMRWLADEGWIDTERAFAASGREDRRYILVMLDSRAHRERSRRRELDQELAGIVGGGGHDEPLGVGHDEPPGRVSQ
jgi:DNA-binding MarR family transcriptional regulator